MLAERLKSTREDRQLSQQDLADRTGISVRQIIRYESGESTPSADALTRLAQELEVSIDFLAGLTDKPRGHVSEAELSPIERKLLRAWRQEDTREILKLLVELTEDSEKGQHITPDQVQGQR